MNVAMFGIQNYEREFFDAANKEHGHRIEYFEANLNIRTAPLAAGYPAVCAFVNDKLDRAVLTALHENGTKLIALRSAGFNHVDVPAAEEMDMTVLRVPAYSPHAVAEHTIALILGLNRKLHRAVARVKEFDFSLRGLLGFDLNKRTVGLIGTGNIGVVVAQIMKGFNCEVIASDIFENPACKALGVQYVSINELAERSDIISLHCPLTPETYRLVNADLLDRMKPGVMLINTSRGGLVDTQAVIQSLKSGHLGSLGIDVYEEEADLFFRDLSGQILQDDVFARLLTFPNVIVTAHQAFFTREALSAICGTTLRNIADFENNCIQEANHVTSEHVHK